MTSKNLGATDILGAADREIRPVRVPEWGGTVHVRSMSGAERDAWEEEQLARSREGEKDGDKDRDLRDFRARFLVRCICDEKGELLFAPKDAEDLSKRNGRALDRLYAVAQILNGLSKQDEAEILGNSAGGRSSASGTA